RRMKEWFLANYTDPVENTPYESAEGGYIFIWGGPYDPREELDTQFGGDVPDEIIQELADELTDIAPEWTGNPDDEAVDEYEKRGQPDLSVFSCTILAHAAPKQNCLD